MTWAVCHRQLGGWEPSERRPFACKPFSTWKCRMATLTGASHAFQKVLVSQVCTQWTHGSMAAPGLPARDHPPRSLPGTQQPVCCPPAALSPCRVVFPRVNAGQCVYPLSCDGCCLSSHFRALRKPYEKPFASSGWPPKGRAFSTLKIVSFVNTSATQQTDQQGKANSDVRAPGPAGSYPSGLGWTRGWAPM